MNEVSRRATLPAPIRTVVRVAGQRLRAELADPEGEPLPTEHVELLLQLRHKERERARGDR